MTVVFRGGLGQNPGMTAPAPQIAFDDFLKVDIRVGRIVAAEPFPEARKPAYRLTIDFGPAIGIKKSSAQITRNHRLEDLPGRLVLAVVNFPPRQIGPTMSEVLTLGVPDADGEVMLIGPWRRGAGRGEVVLRERAALPPSAGEGRLARKRERGEGRQSATAADPLRAGGVRTPRRQGPVEVLGTQSVMVLTPDAA